MSLPTVEQLFHDFFDSFHVMTYDDSLLSRNSVAHRVFMLCKGIQGGDVKPCFDLVKDVFVNDCKKKSKQSKEVCLDILNNGFYQGCPVGCSKYSYKAISTLDTSAPWLWGVIGLLIGAVIAAGVWILVYCLFLRKKASKN